MTERRRTKGEERSYAELLIELHDLEKWRDDDRLKSRLIPRDWHDIERDAPVRPRRTRVTATYDTELVRWFRGLGLGYQARMNAVLRAYMLAVISREIESRGNRDWKGDLI